MGRGCGWRWGGETANTTDNAEERGVNKMNWSIYVFWDYYRWTSIVFVVVIVAEMVIAMLYGKRLFSCKPKVSKKIHSVDTKCQKVSSPIRPFSIPRNRSTDTENNAKTNP